MIDMNFIIVVLISVLTSILKNNFMFEMMQFFVIEKKIILKIYHIYMYVFNLLLILQQNFNAMKKNMSVKPKKALGQHFLTDESICERIVSSLELENIEQIIEIGPGMGAITPYILDIKDKLLYFIEIDKEAANYLKQKFPAIRNKLIIGDFLEMPLDTILNKKNTAIIGNFPYNISTEIIFKVIDNKDFIPEVVGMFQKEVAERFASKSGSKVYGITSVLLQAYYDVEYLFSVAPEVFNPPPKVWSGVIKITRKTTKLDCDEELFKRIVKTAFNQRRKMLSNSLKEFNFEKISDAKDYLTKRPEQLSVEDFINLTKLAEKLLAN